MLSHGAALLSCDGKGWWRCIKSSNCTHLCCHLQELGRLPFWKAKKMAETIQSCRLVVAWLAFVKHPSSGLSRVVYVWSVHVCVSLCLCVSLSPCVSTSLCLSRARVCVCVVCVSVCVCVGWAGLATGARLVWSSSRRLAYHKPGTNISMTSGFMFSCALHV